MNDSRYIIDFYNGYDEESRLTQKHGVVEFFTTMHYIDKYVKEGSKVIEIGAATGRYSHTLARRGYAVDAVELVEHNIDIFRQNTLPGENITITQGNALDLSSFQDNKYDITLLLGPLYHLYSREDKQQAIKEAIRVTKPSGVIFAAYVISDCCLIDEGFIHGNISISEYIKKGIIDGETFASRPDPKEIFELVRKEDIDELMSVFPVKRLHYVSTNGCSLLIREAIDKMDDDTFKLYLKYHLSVCEREDMSGFTSHSLDIFRK